MKKKPKKHAPKKKDPGPPLKIKIDVGPNATFHEVEDRVEKALAVYRTELFRSSNKIVIRIKEEGW